MNSEPTAVQSVKTIRPELRHNYSHHSEAATNEYFTDYVSDASSIKTKSTAGYETPPSRMSTPLLQHNQATGDSQMTLPQRPEAVRPAPLNVRNSQNGRNKRSWTLSRWNNDTPPTPEVDDTPFIRFALDQLTRDEELMGHGRHSLDEETRPIISANATPHASSATLPSQPPQRPQKEPPPPQPSTPKQPATEPTLLLVDPPEGKQWAELGFIPYILRLPPLIAFMLACALMISGIIFSNIHALRSHGLYDYDGTGTPRYFIFQYLPQLLGILILIWLFTIEAAMYRVLPYLSMSRKFSHDGALQDVPLLPANFVLPDLRLFPCGETITGLALLAFWLTNITIPLLACLYQTEWFTNSGTARWRWTTTQGVGWILVALYAITMAGVLCVIMRFRRRTSALMWDPTSLADLLPLFQRSNVLRDFERSEVSPSLAFHLPAKPLRLGFWNTTQGRHVFHSIAQPNSPTNRLSNPVLDEKHISGSTDQRHSQSSAFLRNIHSPYIRYRWVPWYLRDSTVLAWLIIAILLLVGFLVVSFVNNAVFSGFLPLLSSTTHSNGFSSANFLYSFLPALLGTFLFLAWHPIEVYYRAIQAFANLCHQDGASARRSLLLSYPSQLPGIVTISALLNRDFKLAYITFVSLVSGAIPVLAGGVFTAQLFPSQDNQVRMVASKPGYYALCVFLALYALSYAVIWPTRKRYLPHSIDTVAGQLSFLYAGSLMNNPAVRGVRTKRELRDALCGSGERLTGDASFEKGERLDEPSYMFGIYQGRDGREHLGIDILERSHDYNDTTEQERIHRS